MKHVSLAALLMLAGTPAFADGTPPAVYETLAQRRPEITLPVYTPDDKQLVADQAQYFLRDLYVNRLRKIDIYGAANDPVPGVADVVANARTMSEDVLHARLAHLFSSQHDLHLSYSYPAPHMCYRALLPFALEEATDTTGTPVIAVKALATDAKIFDVVPDAKKIHVGDVLVRYDGLAPFDAAKALFETGAGANAYGSVRREIEQLSYRSQRLHALPAADVVALTFQTREGETYDLDLPWVSKVDATCLGFPATTGPVAPAGAKDAARQAADEYQIEFERLYKPNRRESELEALTDTPEPIIHYDIVQNEYGNFGLLRLDSFVPEKLSVPDTVLLIRKLLGNELGQTDGLIIDLRNNGGGMIAMAEGMAQLFTPVDIQPQGFRLLSSQVNRDLYAHAPTFEPEFKAALEVARITGATYTEPLPLSTTLEDNVLGQAYFKPVAVLTNSSCYSSCDMLSAILQDHGAATIWGEDGSTGGGGANNIQMTFLLDSLKATGSTAPFAALPGKQEMGVAWRQTVRVGKHAGQLIEELGVAADQLAAPSIADFYTNDEQQFRKITADLNKQARARKAWYRLTNPERQDLAAGAPLAFRAFVAGTEAIEMKMAGTSLGFQAVIAPASTAGTEVDIQVPATHLAGAGTLGSVDLVGYEAGARVWRGVQQFRVVPEPTALNDAAAPLTFDFQTANLAPITVFTSGADATQGWSAQGGKLKCGLGDHYPDNMHTEAALFLDLSHRTKALKADFDFEGSTEKGYDFFTVQVISGSTKTDVVAPVSGVLAKQHVTFDLTPYAGKAVELRFSFTSDPGVNVYGVAVSNLKIQ